MYSVIKHIRQHYSDMREKETLIANYVLENKDAFISQSIAENAEVIGVSQAGITKFSKKLGFKGLRQLKVELAKENSDHETLYAKELSSEDMVEDTLDKALTNTVTALHNTRQTVDSNELKRAGLWLAEADEVVLFGIGGSRIPCEDLYLKLARIGVRVDVPFDNHVAIAKLQALDESGVLLVFSTSGRTTEIVDILRQARKQGIRSILVTQNVKSAARNNADINLLTSLEENNIRIGTMTARMSQLYLVDALFMRTAMNMGSEIFDNLTRSHEAVQSYKTDE